jgi:four helix bundle protein
LKSRCFAYSVKAVKYISTLPEKRVYWVILNQFIRSATSIGANVIEAKSASSRRDFIKFYDIALKSANETAYWLGIMKEALNINGIEFDFLVKETEELTRILAASLISLKK